MSIFGETVTVSRDTTKPPKRLFNPILSTWRSVEPCLTICNYSRYTARPPSAKADNFRTSWGVTGGVHLKRAQLAPGSSPATFEGNPKRSFESSSTSNLLQKMSLCERCDDARPSEYLALSFQYNKRLHDRGGWETSNAVATYASIARPFHPTKCDSAKELNYSAPPSLSKEEQSTRPTATQLGSAGVPRLHLHREASSDVLLCSKQTVAPRSARSTSERVISATLLAPHAPPTERPGTARNSSLFLSDRVHRAQFAAETSLQGKTPRSGASTARRPNTARKTVYEIMAEGAVKKFATLDDLLNAKASRNDIARFESKRAVEVAATNKIAADVEEPTDEEF